jgi:lipocalin
MARYGDKNLDNLLKCTIEDHECIKVAILDGGADKYGEEPRAPSPTIRNFDVKSMEGTWFKVVGFNPNYDCYACQRNTFTAPEDAGSNLFVSNNKMMMDVEFSMPRMLPDGSPPPPKNVRETIQVSDDDSLFGSQSIGFNDYNTHEVMIFDSPVTPISDASKLLLGKGTNKEATYSRTAHSEGEMFGLKFWENWYVIGENDADEPEFKFIYYNGKTRQNTYEGAFVYSRSKELPQASMAKVYQIARDAGMNPNNFCKIRNGCFKEDETIVKQPESGLGSPSNPFRGILASTKISQLLGVEPVAAEGYLKKSTISQQYPSGDGRAWWFEVGDYLENPHRHFKAMDSLRTTMEWPQDVKQIHKYN